MRLLLLIHISTPHTSTSHHLTISPPHHLTTSPSQHLNTQILFCFSLKFTDFG
ncbi:hypothetical protein [Leyella stercorea]|uniref:hypothetical protein n=1 Tax=Leyella stercorea TaxID=363265 RepID=UPI00242B1BEE|nr:hypothetical protein [Leyella stercorea]